MDSSALTTMRTTGPGWDRIAAKLASYAEIGATFDHDPRGIANNHLQFARDLCPVDTGKMRDSLYLAIESHHAQGEKAEVVEYETERAVSPDAFRVASQVMTFGHSYVRYFLGCKDPAARYVEFGTSKMAAHPFMRPAFEVARQMWRSWCKALPTHSKVQTSTVTLFGLGSRTNMGRDETAR